MSEERIRIVSPQPRLANRLRSLQRNRFPTVSKFSLDSVENVGRYIRARDFMVSNVAGTLVRSTTRAVLTRAPTGLVERPLVKFIMG